MIFTGLLLVLLAILGAPLFTIIASSAMLGYHRDGTDLMNMAIEVYEIANMPFLTAIPLFTFAGSRYCPQGGSHDRNHHACL